MMWLLGLLGLSGAGIGAAFLLGGGPALLLFGGKALGFLKGIPTKVWYALAIIAALAVAFFWHQHVAHKAIKDADAAGYARRGVDDAAAAKKLKDQLDAATRKIGELERTKNVEAHQRVDRAADTVLLRGPGAATCRGGSGAASLAIRPPASGSPGTVNGEVDRLPDAGGVDLIALPFPDAVAFAREHDSCEVDKASWESLYRSLVKVWPH